MKRKESINTEVQKSIVIDTSSSSISANTDYQISDEYIRDLFDTKFDQRKRATFKQTALEGGEIHDTLTGERIVGKISEAKELYGDEWAKHSAETDHIVPVKTVYDKNRNNPFLTNQDIEEIANIEANYNIKSKSTNASKQDSSNIEMLEQLREKGVVVDRETERALRREQRRAETAIQIETTKRTAKNIASEAATGAAEALEASAIPIAMDIIFNIIQVCDRKKDIKTAVGDVAKTVGAVALTGSATKLLNTALQNVDNPVLQFALENNLPAQIVSMVLMIKDDVTGIKNGTLSKEEGTSNILSKFAGLVGGKIGMMAGGKAIALLQANTATQALGTLLASTGGAALVAIPVAIYASAVAKNLFDEVVGKGSWEAIKKSNTDCKALAIAIKESVEGIKTNVAIFTYAMDSSSQLINETDKNIEMFENNKECK